MASKERYVETIKLNKKLVFLCIFFGFAIASCGVFATEVLNISVNPEIPGFSGTVTLTIFTDGYADSGLNWELYDCDAGTANYCYEPSPRGVYRNAGYSGSSGDVHFYKDTFKLSDLGVSENEGGSVLAAWVTELGPYNLKAFEIEGGEPQQEEPACGNGVCEWFENPNTCSIDCDDIEATCGDGACDSENGESSFNCEDDCGQPPPDADCGNNLIETGEVCDGDSKTETCGYSDVGECSMGERTIYCNSDCAWGVKTECVGAIWPQPEGFILDGKDNDCDGEVDEGIPVCGNNVCEFGETKSNCALDCGTPDYIDIVKYYAPVFYQDTDDTYPEADYITNFDFDGDWIASNNFENLDTYRNDPNKLKAYVYYSVIETNNHWYIGYYTFHPRDWKIQLPEFVGHENDMEGAIVVIRKVDGNKYGEFLLMETEAHDNLFKYSNNPTIKTSSDIEGGVTFYFYSHPKLYVESKGHGVCEWSDNEGHRIKVVYEACKHDEGEFPGGDGVIYYPSGAAERPENGNDRNVLYELIPIDSLWYKRHNAETFSQDDAPYLAKFDCSGAGQCSLPAHAPWGWDDPEDVGVEKGEIFFNPVKAMQGHFKDVTNEFNYISETGAPQINPAISLPSVLAESLKLKELKEEGLCPAKGNTHSLEISNQLLDNNKLRLSFTRTQQAKSCGIESNSEFGTPILLEILEKENVDLDTPWLPIIPVGALKNNDDKVHIDIPYEKTGSGEIRIKARARMLKEPTTAAGQIFYNKLFLEKTALVLSTICKFYAAFDYGSESDCENLNEELTSVSYDIIEFELSGSASVEEKVASFFDFNNLNNNYYVSNKYAINSYDKYPVGGSYATASMGHYGQLQTFIVGVNDPDPAGTQNSIGLFLDFYTAGDFQSAFITIPYDENNLGDVLESTLRAYYWDPSLGNWVMAEQTGVNTEQNYVWAFVSHFSTYTVIGIPESLIKFNTEPDLIINTDNIDYNKYLYKTRSGDLNNDGLNDIVVLRENEEQAFYVYYQNSDGSFNDVPDVEAFSGHSFGHAIDLADLNNDGLTDVIMSQSGESGGKSYIKLYYQKENGIDSTHDVMLYSNGDAVYDLDHGDFNNDGLTDFAYVGSNPTSGMSPGNPGNFWVSIFYQIPEGKYNSTEFYRCLHRVTILLHAADLNGDGLDDIINGHDKRFDDSLELLYQDPITGFSHHAGSDNCAPNWAINFEGDMLFRDGLTSGDFNNDTLRDILYMHVKGRSFANVKIHYGTTTGVSNSPNIDLGVSPNEPRGVFAGDLNNNGLDDIIVSTSGFSQIYYQENNRIDGTIDEILDIQQALTIADLNNDGLNDIVGVNPQYDIVIYYQQSKKFDLEVKTDDILFSNTEPTIRDILVITAEIHNKNGPEGQIPTFNVEFYNGEPSEGNLIGSDELTVPVGENSTAFVIWSPETGGTNNIYVLVDPEDKVSETTKENNLAFNSLEVTANTPPVVTVFTPNGDEFWSGTKEITWEATDLEGDSLDIRLKYTDPAHALYLIELSTRNDGSYSWDTTSAPDGTYKAVVEAFDGTSWVIDTSDDWFTIDNTAPNVTIQSPLAGNYSYTDGLIDILYAAIDNVDNLLTIIIELDGIIYDLDQINLNDIALGIHNLIIRAIDRAGNVGTAQVVFEVIDDITPVSIATLDGIPGQNNWYVSDVEVTITANDEKSGIESIGYNFDGSNTYTNYTSPVTVTYEGATTLYYRAVDTSGNEEAQNSITFKIDKTPPSTTDDAPLDWVNHDITVILTPYDNVSGVWGTFPHIMYPNGTVVSLNATKLFFDMEGITQVNYYSKDFAGNQEAGEGRPVNTFYVKIDKTPPTTVDDAPEGWQSSDFTVNLNATDTLSGTNYTTYRIDSGAWMNGTSILIDQEGNLTIEYYSVDNAGNIENAKTTYAALDKTPPITVDNAPTGWINYDITVTLNATDSLSGVASTYYCLDQADTCTPTTPGTSIPVTYEGINYVRYHSIDNAGNSETVKSAQVNLDKTPPEVSVWLDPEQDLYSNLEPLPVQYTAIDPQVQGTPSNQLALVWDIDGTIVDDPTNITAWMGTHTLTLTATDLAGNSNSSSVNFTAKLTLVGEGQLKITPESLKVNPGVLTVHIHFPEPYNGSEILSGICDYAEHDFIAGSNIKFRREDIEAALAEQNETLDIHFEVNGTFLYNGQELFFEGWDNITKIVD